MSGQLRIGYIGTGVIAEKQMVLLKEANVPGVAVTAAADIHDGRLRAWGARHGVTRLYRDWREMLANEALDAVSVCTPNNVHCEPVVGSLRAGRHVLLEKPMSITSAEAELMAAEAKKADRLLMMAFQHRFSAEAQMLRRYAREGAFGDILYVRAQALRRRGIPSWGVFGRKDIQGGGSLIDIGVHVMEMAHYIMGAPKPASVRGCLYRYMGDKPCGVECKWGPWDHESYTVEDMGIGFVTFEGGASMTVETSFAAHIEEDVWNIQVMGTKGGGTLSPAKVFLDRCGYMQTGTPAYLDKTDGFILKMRHFCECVMDGIPCIAPAEDGLAIQRMLEGLYLSAESGREIVL